MDDKKKKEEKEMQALVMKMQTCDTKYHIH